MELNLTKKAVAAVVGSIGFPSKMPGTAYGISAKHCKTGSKLAEVPGSVCFDCYALKGNYVYPSVETAHDRREANLESPTWVPAMAMLLLWTHARGKNRQGEPISVGFHRWHDSGDIQSVSHLAKICEVATRTPKIAHWLPTRELGMVKDYLAQGGIIPANMNIRLSDYMVDGTPSKLALELAKHSQITLSGVHQNTTPAADTKICEAPLHDNECRDCRACWSTDVARVSYHKH